MCHFCTFMYAKVPMSRTPNNVERKRANIIRRMEHEKEGKEVKYGERAVKRAKRAGVQLDPMLQCGYTHP